MITEDEFKISLKILSYCQETYDTKKAPANVERIIFPRKEFIGDAKILLQYFYQEKGRAKSIPVVGSIKSEYIENITFSIIKPWKLSDYVKFIRAERDILLPNDYKKKSKKFISRYPYVRSSLLSQYEKELYEKWRT